MQMKTENDKSSESQSPGKIPRERFLSSKTIQIQAVSHPGDFNCGPHVELFALCEDGSIWIQYVSSGGANVPTDGFWELVQPPAGWRRV